jgi:TRAP-type mannitol/chloroaromatic compound transport system permease small subunit
LRADQTESLLDRISSITGKAAAWLTLFMVIVTFIVVIMRYVFDAGLKSTCAWISFTEP